MKKKPKHIFDTLAQRLKRTPTKIQNTQLMHPAREWLIGIGLALTICVLGATWSAATYLYYERITFEPPEPAGADTSVYREAVVTAALATYAERRVSYDQFLVEGPRQLKRAEDEATSIDPVVQASEPESSAVQATSTATTSEPTASLPASQRPTSSLDLTEPSTLVP